MRIICDEIPIVCNDCIFCRRNEYGEIGCTLLNRAIPHHAIITRRFSGCPLVHVDEIFNYKFKKESVYNAEGQGV